MCTNFLHPHIDNKLCAHTVSNAQIYFWFYDHRISDSFQYAFAQKNLLQFDRILQINRNHHRFVSWNCISLKPTCLKKIRYYLSDNQTARLTPETSNCRCAHPSATSRTIISKKPAITPNVPPLECVPRRAAGISSSATTYSIAPAAKANSHGISGWMLPAINTTKIPKIGSTIPDMLP